uniref:Uncharacterized protein AlNc14C1G152 n=1 Tax=Albugo laibachii Nc14 TaxID=890382 RepID=F0VZ05_9STRA|nr:conserved hypothetical protein [Albugo laibachii Nc14]|eukprot:CCA14020.1 conserved hypothetical protein [Albugo laibachii Nc14]
MGSDEEVPAVKKLHEGYHGWMKSIAKTSQDFTPLRIDNKAETETAERSKEGSSAWNTAGTWEEKDKSAWACDRLKKYLCRSFRFEDAKYNTSLEVDSIVRCDGEAKLVYSRGVKRCGFDISVKFEWKSTRENDSEGFDEVKGHVEIHDFDDMNGEDYEVRVSTEECSAHARDAKDAILNWEDQLRKILADWKEELLQQ